MRVVDSAMGIVALAFLGGCGGSDPVGARSGPSSGGTTFSGGAGNLGGSGGSGIASGASAGSTNAAGSTSTNGGTAGAGGTSTNGAQGGTGGTPIAVGPCPNLPAVGTWEDITPTTERGIDGTVYNTQALALDPFDAQTVWLGTARPNQAMEDSASGLFKSTDCGDTWAHVNTGTNATALDGSSLWSMAVDAVDQGVMYVVGANGALGLFKSTNAGLDWEQLFTAETEYATHVQANFVGGIMTDPTNHLHLVATAHGACSAPYGADGSSCQAETLDAGETWTLVPNPDGLGFVENAGAYLISEDNWIYSTPFGSTYRTTDHGTTWNVVGPAIEAGESGHHPLVVAPDGNYYLPSNAGVVMSDDEGASWTLLPGTPGGYGFAMGDGRLYICPEFNLSYRTAALSDLTSWTEMPNPPTRAEGRGSAFMDYDETHHVLYSSNFEGGLFRMVTE